MMNRKKFSPRIVIRQRSNFKSVTLSVCHHERSRISGSPCHRQLFAVKSFKDSEVNNIETRRAVWKQIDDGCLRLMVKNRMSNAERTAINQRFQKIIRMPSKDATPKTPPTGTANNLLDRFPILTPRP
jgi:hypothetical protein